MNLLVLDIQSTSDVITNSSSEVFILKTNKTCEEVNNILKSFTSGFRYPEIFHLDEYRKWRETHEDDGKYHEETLYDYIRDFFIDPENDDDMIYYYKEFLFNPWEYMKIGEHKYKTFGCNCYHQINIDFWKYLDNYTEEIKKIIPKYEPYKTYQEFDYDEYNLRWNIPGSIIKNFMDTYTKEIPRELELSKYDNVLNLNGKVLVLSEYDNSIPFDDFNKINELFNGYNKHLG